MAVGKIEQLSSRKPTTRELIEELRRERDPIGFEMATLRAERDRYREALEEMLRAIENGSVNSEEIDLGDGTQPHRFHEEWAHHARQALKGDT